MLQAMEAYRYTHQDDQATILYSLNGGIYSSNNPITGLSAGCYSIVARDSNGCTTKADTVCLNDPSGVIDSYSSSWIRLSSNPVGSSFSIIFGSEFLSKYPTIKILLTDVAGRRIFNTDMIDVNTPVEINSSDFVPGLYFIEILDKDNRLISLTKIVR
jgi:hypothetical protein